MHLRAVIVLVVMATFGVGSTMASANVPLVRISTDTFQNTTSQHATEVEPDTFAVGT